MTSTDYFVCSYVMKIAPITKIDPRRVSETVRFGTAFPPPEISKKTGLGFTESKKCIGSGSKDFF